MFGDDACTTGAEHDLKQATADAAQFVRHYGFAGRLSRTDVTHEMEDDINTDIHPTNAAIEALLQEQYARAMRVLQEHSAVFLRITQALAEFGEVSKPELAQWLGLTVAQERSVLEPYADHLAAFAEQQTHYMASRQMAQYTAIPICAANAAKRPLPAFQVVPWASKMARTCS